MPKLIINGAVAEDRWPTDHIQTLERWQELAGKASTAVRLEPDEPPELLLQHLSDIELVVINFTSFMDGRGFSYARELRDQGMVTPNVTTVNSHENIVIDKGVFCINIYGCGIGRVDNNCVVVDITTVAVMRLISACVFINPQSMIAVFPVGIIAPTIVYTNVKTVNSFYISAQNFHKTTFAVFHVIVLHKGVYVFVVDVYAMRIEVTTCT